MKSIEAFGAQCFAFCGYNFVNRSRTPPSDYLQYCFSYAEERKEEADRSKMAKRVHGLGRYNLETLLVWTLSQSINEKNNRCLFVLCRMVAKRKTMDAEFAFIIPCLSYPLHFRFFYETCCVCTLMQPQKNDITSYMQPSDWLHISMCLPPAALVSWAVMFPTLNQILFW